MHPSAKTNPTIHPVYCEHINIHIFVTFFVPSVYSREFLCTYSETYTRHCVYHILFAFTAGNFALFMLGCPFLFLLCLMIFITPFVFRLSRHRTVCATADSLCICLELAVFRNFGRFPAYLSCNPEGHFAQPSRGSSGQFFAV